MSINFAEFRRMCPEMDLGPFNITHPTGVDVVALFQVNNEWGKQLIAWVSRTSFTVYDGKQKPIESLYPFLMELIDVYVSYGVKPSQVYDVLLNNLTFPSMYDVKNIVKNRIEGQYYDNIVLISHPPKPEREGIPEFIKRGYSPSPKPRTKKRGKKHQQKMEVGAQDVLF